MLTITGIDARDARNGRSRCPERLLTISGIGAQDRPEQQLTMVRNTHDRGQLWVATQFGGVDRFDPKAERFTVYRHEPGNPNSIGSGAVESIARDTRGCLWLGPRIAVSTDSIR
jgi:ligand-binding sensor domain-containing protein